MLLSQEPAFRQSFFENLSQNMTRCSDSHLNVHACMVPIYVAQIVNVYGVYIQDILYAKGHFMCTFSVVGFSLTLYFGEPNSNP